MRLWQVSREGHKLLHTLHKVSDCLKENAPMHQSPSTETTPEVEENTGIDCPGESLEPYMGTLMTLEDKNFSDEAILVEIADPNFVFRYQKQERAFFGKCEWCMKNKLLNVVCKCKRVRYCDEDC